MHSCPPIPVTEYSESTESTESTDAMPVDSALSVTPQPVQTEPLRCKLGLHKWSPWKILISRKYAYSDWLTVSERTCIGCNKRQHEKTVSHYG